MPCRSLNELLFESHRLHAADARQVADIAASSGFVEIRVFDTWRRDPLAHSVSPLVVGRRGREAMPRVTVDARPAASPRAQG
jgi:hypothetical protein